MRSIQPHRFSKSQTHGAILIFALFIVFILSALALAIMHKITLDTHRTQLLLQAKAAEATNEGALLAAFQTLKIASTTKAAPTFPIRSPITRDGQAIVVSLLYNQETLANQKSSLLPNQTAVYFINMINQLNLTKEDPVYLLETVVTFHQTHYRFYTLFQAVFNQTTANMLIAWQSRGIVS